MRTPILALLISFAPAAALADVDRYEGICDGSAAVALGPDHFIVANDDEDILKIYRLHEAAAVGEVDVIDFLGNRQPNDEVEEADIEGAARIGDRVYWIASHGRDTDAVVQPTRRVFFATDIVPDGTVPTVKVAGTPYRGLLDDLRGEAKFAPLRLAAAIDADVSPETKGGFNIEGLAATADGQLLIGFRNPLFEGRAIVVTLENPDETHSRRQSGIRPRVHTRPRRPRHPQHRTHRRALRHRGRPVRRRLGLCSLHLVRRRRCTCAHPANRFERALTRGPVRVRGLP